ncbi:ABC transporter substrate-binding protein [Paraglaciecola sp. L3A3]|uniref:substrate-binding periplasmic protein n=1 Tax=Paraglaciecola sp. L3A3 TaxID=2686358 RepID=UPI001E4C4A12|nr:transporter substrate-binding domain-containing protein [Paraglaciecola sp. L3A3]
MTVLKNKRLGIQLQRLVSIVILITGASVSNLSQANTLKVCYDQWPPMTIFPSDTATDRGVVIDMLEQIYSAKGYQLEYYEVPLARGLNMVAEGLCDMLPEYLHSESAEQDFEFAKQASFVYPSAFVVRKNDPWRYQGIQSIKGKRIATGPGWDYSSMSDPYQKYLDDPQNTDFIEVIAGYDDVIERILRMLKENRVDLYADNELVLQYVLNRLKLNDELSIIRPGLEKPLVEIPIFSRKIPRAKRQKLINIWDQGRLSMPLEQEKALLNKYQVTLQ